MYNNQQSKCTQFFDYLLTTASQQWNAYFEP